MKTLAVRMGWILGWVLAVTGCRTVPPMAAWDLGSPGWTVQTVPAVWRPETGGPELVGELMVAHHRGGARFVQFSKQGVPVVTARSDDRQWEVGSSLRSRGYRGRGRAPGRVLWFQVDGVPPNQPEDSRWHRELQADGAWVLEDRRRGERLEGVTP
jgi:hypothetical protein